MMAVMSCRERMLATLAFRGPDRLPVVYHPSPAGLYRHGQPLLDLFRRYPPDNPVDFGAIPQPPAESLRNGRYCERQTDAWGTQWEYLHFGLAGIPCGYPLANWQAEEKYQFPSLWPAGTAEFTAQHQLRLAQQQQHLVFAGWVSIFEKLHALRPMDEVLVGLLERDRHLLHLLDRLTDYWRRVIEMELASGAEVLMFGDDWGAQTGPIISVELFREIFRPRYRELFSEVRRRNGKVFFHSCGRLGPILDKLFDLGVDGLWPQIAFVDSADFARRCRKQAVTCYLHPDRQQLIPHGTPQAIEARIRTYAERYHGLGGGAIFYIEIENDAPFSNVAALIQAVHKWR